MRESKKIYFLISGLIVFLDQVTKYLIVKTINYQDTIDIFPFFRIVHVTNKGAAFGSLQNVGNPFFIIISLIAISIIIFLIIRGKENPLGLSCVLGGAIGNLIDRLRFGYVIDFLDFYIGRYHWPAFNVADSSISIGIVLLLLTYILPSQRKKLE